MVTAAFDPAHGGRWTSLRAAGREWLWHRPDPARSSARPGDPFVDAGGVEECVPTIRGVPDHGAAWSRPWAAGGVDCGDFRLFRDAAFDGDALGSSGGDVPGLFGGDVPGSFGGDVPGSFGGDVPGSFGGHALGSFGGHALGSFGGDAPGSSGGHAPGSFGGDAPGSSGGHAPGSSEGDALVGSEGGALVVSYRLEAEPGFRFVWAAHALLDLSPAATLEAAPGTETRIDGGAVEPWPTPLAALGPDDGTAIGAILVDCPTVTVADGERLTFTLDAPGQPVSTALWRNLRGWPDPAPYRSIGVEPMLGRVFDLAEAGPGDAAVVPRSGACEWRLRITSRADPESTSRQPQAVDNYGNCQTRVLSWAPPRGWGRSAGAG